jgi:translocation and assembly module TamB
VTATIDSIALEAMLDNYALAVDAAVESSTLGHADIALTTADIRDPDAPIGGSAEIEWPDLSVLTLLSPDVGEVGGTVALALELAGTAASPEISGSGTLSDGRVAIPQWGVLVDRISGEAQGSAGRTVRYRGSGFIEDAEIRVAGETELDPAANWPTRLTLQGDNVPVASRPDATVIASPDFAVEIRLPRIDVSGTVLVPEALLAVEQLPNQAVRESADSVVHGALQQAEVRPLELNALVAVELGDNVRYTGSNLDTQLSGALTIEYISGRSPIAGGRVGLDGSYQAYGQTLTLDSGELLFAGPLDDPAIDVLAAKTVGQNTIGVRLSGTLRAPLTTLYSNPPLSDLNVLSYLAFNRPAQGSGEEESSALQAAALALGIQQALPAVQRVGETLGLDELTIEATEIDAGSLMAGKYLSPRVYLSYTYGLFNRLGGFLLRYDINDRFSLETRSGDEKAMDLLYSVEKD